MNTETTTKKILITWWLWYIWSHTAVLFGEAGYEIILVDNLSHASLTTLTEIETLIWYKPTFYELDIRNKKWLTEIFTDHPDIEWVIHFAAKKSVSESCDKPFDYYGHNVIGSLILLRTMLEHNIKNIVFSSTAALYDTTVGIPPFVETDLVNPTNPYGTSKHIVEQLLRDVSLQKQYNTIALRYFNVIGAHPSGRIGDNPDTPQNLLPCIFDVVMKKKEKLHIFGNNYETPDGTAVRDYIHVMDIARAHLLAYSYIEEFEDQIVQWHEQLQWLYDVFNIGTGEWTSIMHMHDMVQQVIKKEIPYTYAPRRAWDSPHVIANAQKAQKVLWREAEKTLYEWIEDQRNFLQKVHGIA